MARYYQRSNEARAWRKLYKRTRWAKLKEIVKSEEPRCVFCLADGRPRLATSVDHIIPHKGDETLFFDRANLQGLCEDCHNITKRQIEEHGYHCRVDRDGWPIDPNHPANRKGS